MAAQVMLKHHQDIPEVHADEILEALEKNVAWQQELFGKEGCLSRLFALIYQASEPAVEPESLRSMIQFRLAEGIQGLVHCRPCSFFFWLCFVWSTGAGRALPFWTGILCSKQWRSMNWQLFFLFVPFCLGFRV